MPEVIETVFQTVPASKLAENFSLPLGWAVISHHLMPNQQDRRLAYGKWHKFQSKHTHVFRVLRFSPQLGTGMNRSKTENAGLVIDWMGWLELSNHQEKVDVPLKLKITPVSSCLLPFLILKHPDPTHRLAGGLAWLSRGIEWLSLMKLDCLLKKFDRLHHKQSEVI